MNCMSTPFRFESNMTSNLGLLSNLGHNGQKGHTLIKCTTEDPIFQMYYIRKKRIKTVSIVSAVFRDALVIVEVGDSQAVPKVRAHLFPRDDERRLNVFVSLCPEHHRALGLVPRRPCHHCVIVMAQQLFLLEN